MGNALLGGGSRAASSSAGGGLLAVPSAAQKKILFALIAKDSQNVLVDHAGVSQQAVAANFKEVTMQILSQPKLDKTVEFKSYRIDDLALHYSTDKDSGRLFVCITDWDMSRRLPYGFLQELKDAFASRNYTEEQLSAGNVGILQSNFAPEMGNLVEKFNSSNDPLTNIMKKVRSINDELMESIDKVLERSEKIELLLQKSEALRNDSITFHRSARAVHRRAWWRNVKVTLFICFGIVLVIFILLVFSCGITFKHC